MNSLKIYGAEDMRWEESEKPTLEAGQVLLRVHYVGICGSDLHYYFHGDNGGNVIREPFTPGHELSATIAEDPDNEWKVGTKVTVHPARFGEKDDRSPQRQYLWAGGDYLGSASCFPHRQGGAAEYIAVDRAMIRALPEGLGLKEASLAEPLAVALHAVNIGNDVIGDRALVLGGGPIGLLVAAALKEKGVKDVALGDIQEAALERGKSLGVDETFHIGVEQVPDGSYPVVFECSAAAPSLTQAIKSVYPGGVVVQVGTLPNAEIKVNLAPLVSKEVQLRGTLRFNTEIDDAISILHKNPTIVDVVTHEFPAEEAVEAFNIAKNSAASGKVLIHF